MSDRLCVCLSQKLVKSVVRGGKEATASPGRNLGERFL